MYLKNIVIAGILLLFIQCQSNSPSETGGSVDEGEHHHRHEEKKQENHFEIIELSEEKLQSIELRYDTLQKKSLSRSISANGRMKLAPNQQSMISSVISARVKQINVIEGDPVRKGEVLALLEGPEIIRLQRKYLENKAQLPYLKKEYERKKRLLEENVGAARKLQKAKADYKKTLAQMQSQRENLEMLNIFNQVKAGNVQSTAPVVAPFSGHIGEVSVSRGQFVDPHQSLLQILNTNKMHIELHIYERNIHAIEKGQHVLFTYANRPGSFKEGHIYRVGKQFHPEKQSIHVHAHIKHPDSVLLIPGLYINARIQVPERTSYALPAETIIREGQKTYVFAPAKALSGISDQFENYNTDSAGSSFVRIPVKTGSTDNGYTSIRSFPDNIPKDIPLVSKGAYYLQAEMKKEVGGHHH